MQREDLLAWLRLASTPGIGNVAARRLLAAFGLPDRIFQQPRDVLLQVVTPALATALATQPDALALQFEAAAHWLDQGTEAAPRHILTLADASYPPALLEIADPPLLLYAVGQVPLSWPKSMAMVGSRNPTPQGLANARAFARSLTGAGFTVVSGLALGIDGAAHEGALEGAAPGALATVAVVGTGLDRVYPRQHLQLAHRIAAQGLLLSEYPLGTPPLSANFPKRNRIIAALSEGTLVVEAAVRSGSLITARQAVEQGKDVFAIPGSIHSPQSRGCHELLKQGAKLVETVSDVLEELGPGHARAIVASANGSSTLRDHADSLLQALGFDPVGLDALIARTGIAASELQARLLELELDQRVTRLQGGLFQRIALA